MHEAPDFIGGRCCSASVGLSRRAEWRSCDGWLVELLAEPRSRGLSGLLVETLVEIAERLRFFDQRIRAYDLRIERLCT